MDASSLTLNNSRQDKRIRDPAKRQKTSHSARSTIAHSMFQQVVKEATRVLGRDQDGLDLEQPDALQENPTFADLLTVETPPFPTGLEHSTASSDEESDDGSIFQVIGDQGNGNLSLLCAHCQYIFDNWFKGLNDKDFRFPHYKDAFQLERSALDGCALCAQFLQSRDACAFQAARDEMNEAGQNGFDAPGVSAQTYSDAWYKTDSVGVGEGTCLLELKFLYPSEPNADPDLEDLGESIIIEFSVAMIPAVFPALIYSPEDGTLTNTGDGLALAKRWLQRCYRSHWLCKSHERFIPSRLVCTDEDGIRLCLSNEFREPPEYATLSHCWGTTKFLTLERSNLELFRSGIPQEAMSQTFKDSIQIARNLGFLYIWIDSLCILQDDAEDWRREAALMSSVYGGSGINIAASGAVDGSVGCLFKRPHTWRCQVQTKIGNQTLLYDCVPFGMYRESLSKMPLSKRGWSLQERLLAPRTLHFTPTQIYWECHQKVACETFPEEFPARLAFIDCYLNKQPISRSMWCWIVERYAACELTYAKDKLVAISGLARRIQMHTRDQYVAGMWRNDLEFLLCWSVAVDGSGRRVTPYRAPTWSWASLDCSINITDHERFKESKENTQLWVHILDIQVKFCGPDPFGQISMANLCLSCSCLLHVTILMGDEENFMIVAGKSIEVIVYFDCLDASYGGKLHEVHAMPVVGGSTNSGRISGLMMHPTSRHKVNIKELGSFCFGIQKHQRLSKRPVASAPARQKILNSPEFAKTSMVKFIELLILFSFIYFKRIYNGTG